MSSFRPDKAAREEAQQLINRLTRLKSAWPSEPTLPTLSPQVIDALLEQTDVMQAKANKATAITSLLVVIAFWALMCSLQIPDLWDWCVGLSCFCLLGCALASYPIIVRLRIAAAQQWTTYALTQTNDMHVLSTLVQATRHKWGNHPEVTNAIKRLLRQVREEHAGLLSPSAQNRLWKFAIEPKMLHEGYDEVLAMAALHALAYTGNGTMLWNMRHLAYQIPYNSVHPRLIDTAQQLVPIIEARFLRQQVPQTLLRASDKPTAQAEVLLRAAQPAPAEPMEQLLRASPTERAPSDT